MNTGYYQSVLQQLYAIQNSLPDFLEPEERQAIENRIRSLQAHCTTQIQEIIAYDSRKPDM